MESIRLISVQTAARLIDGLDYTTLQNWLEEPTCPIGRAVKGIKTTRYIIPLDRFLAYFHALDLGGKIPDDNALEGA